MRPLLSPLLAGAAALLCSVAPLSAAPPLGFQTPEATSPSPPPAAPASPSAQAAPAKPKPAPAPTPTPTPPEVPPPYEPQLLRLSELIGALSYLRDLCGDGDSDAFRTKFSTLVDAEGVTETRKDALAGAFNRGFRDYQLTYRACTPTAREIITRFLDEADHLSRDVANRYAG